MPTPDELRTTIAQARTAFRSSLESAASAWETKPASGEGEDSWSPRQVAEHAIPTEVFFATAVCDACGYPGVQYEGPSSFATAAEAVAALDGAVALADGRLKYVSDTDLPKRKDDATRTAQEWMELAAYHLNDHAQQIKTTIGG
jgi:hypothetical protein